MLGASGKFPGSQAGRQLFGEIRDAFFAIARDEFAQRREQGRMGEGIALDPGEDRLREGFSHEGEGRLTLFGGDGVVVERIGRELHHSVTLDNRTALREAALAERLTAAHETFTDFRIGR
jgi:hypothetical protein